MSTPTGKQNRTRSEDTSAPTSFTLPVRAVPNAKKSEIVGWHGDELKIKIAAPALDGKANAELVSFLSETFVLHHSLFEVTAGQKGRSKLIRIQAPPDKILPMLPPRS